MQNETPVLSSPDIARRLLVSFGIAFLVMFLLLQINQLLLLTRFFRENQPKLAQGLLLLVYGVPAAVTMSIPYAVCTGFVYGLIKMNFVKQFLHNKKTVIPVLMLGLLISIAAFVFSDVVLPNANARFSQLYRTIGMLTVEEEAATKSLREMSSLELITIINEAGTGGERLNVYILELHKKYSLPLGAFFFALFASALSVLLGKHLKTAVCVSVLACVVYWAFLIYGQIFSIKSGDYGAPAMWLPNIVFVSVSTALWLAKYKSSVIDADS